MAVDILSIIASIFIGLGIIGSGIWTIRSYMRERRKFPKANLSHKVQAIKLTDDKVCIHTFVRIQNIGDVMLSICSAKNIIYQIRPLHGCIQERLKDGIGLYDELGKEIEWPIIGRSEVKWAEHQFEIEPGEEDTVDFDLIVPSDVEVIQVYTYFANVAKRKHEIGWSSLDFYEVAKIAQLGGEEMKPLGKKIEKQQAPKPSPQPPPLKETQQPPKREPQQPPKNKL